MTKNELAERIAQSADLGIGQARNVVDTVIESISEELSRGGEVALAGFGKFSVSHRAARQGRNPATGQTIQHPGEQGRAVLGGQRAQEAAQLAPPLADPGHRSVGPVVSGAKLMRVQRCVRYVWRAQMEP